MSGSFFGGLPPIQEEKLQHEELTQEELNARKQPSIDPHFVLIDGSNLIRAVKDDPSIKEGRTDIGSGTFPPPLGHWVPANYNPVTGELVDTCPYS